MKKLTTISSVIMSAFIGVLSSPFSDKTFAGDDGKSGFRWVAKFNLRTEMAETSGIPVHAQVTTVPEQFEFSETPSSFYPTMPEEQFEIPVMPSSYYTTIPESGQISFGGQESLAQMRASLFATNVPGFNFLGGPVAMTIHLPADGEPITLKLEARLNTGYIWEVLAKDGALYQQTGESKFAMRYDEVGAPSLQTIQLEAIGRGESTIHLVYHRPFEPDTPSLSTVEVWMDRSVREIDLSNPTQRAPISGIGVKIPPPPFSDIDVKLPPSPPPPSWDWRTKGIIPDVRDQGACDSSWAFGTVSVMESAIAKETGTLVDLSEQFLISCNQDGWGCSGGYTATNYYYNTLANKQTKIGAVLESDKTYIADDSSCSEAYDHPYMASKWRFVTGLPWDMPTVIQLKSAIYAYGPVTAYVCVDSDWEYYKGGIYTPLSNECTGTKKVSHQIVLVGWDDSTSSWIVRNSWGPNWGEGGYMRIAWDTDGTKSRVGFGASWVQYTHPGKTTVNFNTSSQTVTEKVGKVTVTATLSTPTTVDVTVPYTVSGTATGNGVDHDLASSSITIPARKKTGTTTFNVTNDALYEENETIVVSMGKITNADKGAVSVHTVTIKDDDSKPLVTLIPKEQTVQENVGNVNVTAVLSKPAGVDITVPVWVVWGTATGGGVDYEPSKSSLVIPAGKTSGTAPVLNIINDGKPEEDEILMLATYESDAVPRSVEKRVLFQKVIIKDDDPLPKLTFSSDSQSVSENIGTVTITARISAESLRNMIVPFSVTGTATGGGIDHNLSNGSINIPAGKMSASTSFAVTNDALYEKSETVIVSMGTVSGADKGAVTVHTVTITDDDQPAKMLIFLLMGQSNMSGRNEISKQPVYANKSRSWVFGNDWKWKTPGADPVDRADGQIDKVSLDLNAGVSPALPFAERMATLRPGINIGLVPCAKEGTSIEQWAPNVARTSLYGSCLARAKEAASYGGTIGGVLWWQGETDAASRSAAYSYADRFMSTMNQFRLDYGASLPVVTVRLRSEMVHNISFPYWDVVRSQLESLGGRGYPYVSCDGLDFPDKIHASTATQQIIGTRMADLMNTLLP